MSQPFHLERPEAAPPKGKRRRELDRYYTPTWATEALILKCEGLRGERILDPSSGDGRMSKRFIQAGRFSECLLNDADNDVTADTHLDATQSDSWDRWNPFGATWCISNLPFNVAPRIAWNALERGYNAAFLLRITFLEPVESRRWLIDRPPAAIIVLSRCSFDGSGQTDSTTCAWHIWGPVTPGITIVHEKDINAHSQGLLALPKPKQLTLSSHDYLP